jgi:UDP-GlcNAc:undecaprenyl-phosphate GlcNAc-1-phosphate transferase
MFLGLVIGSLTIMGDYTRYNNMAFISGLLILTIPLFDTLYVIILRLAKGKSPFFGSPDHFCLRMKKKFGLTTAKTVALTGFIQLLLSVVIIVNFYTTPGVTFITSGVILLFFTGFGIYLARENME